MGKIIFILRRARTRCCFVLACMTENNLPMHMAINVIPLWLHRCLLFYLDFKKKNPSVFGALCERLIEEFMIGIKSRRPSYLRVMRCHKSQYIHKPSLEGGILSPETKICLLGLASCNSQPSMQSTLVVRWVN